MGSRGMERCIKGAAAIRGSTYTVALLETRVKGRRVNGFRHLDPLPHC